MDTVHSIYASFNLNTDRYLIAGYVMMVAIVLEKAPRRKADKADNTTGEVSLRTDAFCACILNIRPLTCSKTVYCI